MSNKKVVLITGASAGMGRATAIHLAQNGYIVYGAARRTDKMQELKNYGIKPIELDITKDESIVACVNQIFKEAERIDILVNNAGFGMYGSVEDVSMEDARYQLEVNVIGAMRLTQLILPKMRENKYGKIVNMSSTGGKVAGPFGGWYYGSKFILEGLSDSLRQEVKPFGIDVILIEPGGIKSEWANIAFDNLIKNSTNAAYKNRIEKMVGVMRKAINNNSDPMVIVKLIKESIESKNPKTRYVGGFMGKPLLFMRKILSDKMFDKLIASQFG